MNHRRRTASVLVGSVMQWLSSRPPGTSRSCRNRKYRDSDARRTVIPDGGHAIIWTHPAEVNRALVGFLRAL